MAYYSECQLCGCALDSGEGNICSECIESQEEKSKYQIRLQALINESVDGQLQIIGI